LNKLFKKYWLYILFVAIGGFAGYLYWYYIGCNSGSCPITSNWYGSMAYGLLIGYLTGSVVQEQIHKRKPKKATDQNKE